MTATMTTAELAAELDTTPRALRKFMRAQDAGVGKGSRYAIPANARSIASLRKKFAKWEEEEVARKTTESDITPDAE